MEVQKEQKIPKWGCVITIIVLLICGLVIYNAFSPKRPQTSTSSGERIIIKEPLKYLTTISGIKSFKDSLHRIYQNNFTESSIVPNRIIWHFEHKLYDGLISYDVDSNDPHKIIKSEFNFTINPQFKTDQNRFPKAWGEGLKIANLWLFYASDNVLSMNNIVDFYTETLEGAKYNRKYHNFDSMTKTAVFKGQELYFSCDLSGLLTFRLKKL